MGVPVAGFKMSEPMKGRTQGSGGMGPAILVKIKAVQGLGEHSHDTVDSIFEFGIARTGITVSGLIEPRMLLHKLSPGSPDRRHSIVARTTDRSLSQPVREQFTTPQAQQSKQIVPAVDMAVQRWLLDSEFDRDLGQSEVFDPIGIRETRCDIEDLCLVEWEAFTVRHGGSCLSRTRPDRVARRITPCTKPERSVNRPVRVWRRCGQAARRRRAAQVAAFDEVTGLIATRRSTRASAQRPPRRRRPEGDRRHGRWRARGRTPIDLRT